MSVARHTVYNFVGAVVPLAVSLVTVPIYLQVIGAERYGLLAICWLLIGYFNIFDFGLGRATAQKVASLVDAGPEARSRTLWTSLLLSGALSLLAMALLVPFARYGLSLMNVGSEALRGEVGGALPWLVLAVPFGIFNGLLVGALEGRREFLKVNLVNSLATAGIAIFPLVAAWAFGPELWHLLAAALLARSAGVGGLAVAAMRTVPLLGPRAPRRGEVSSMLRFGGWTTMSNVVGPLLAFWDRFVIGATISAAAVAVYVIPFSLVWQLQVLPASLASALFPRLAGASAEEARELADEGVRVLAFLMTPISLLILIVSGPFLLLWLGSETGAATAPVASVLLFGLWVNAFARMPYVALQAQARPQYIAAAHLAEALPYVLLLFVLLHVWGVVGAALAWSIRCTADALLLHYFAGGSYRPLLRLIPHAALILVAIMVALAMPMDTLGRWALLAALLGIACIYVFLDIPPRVRILLGSLKHKLLRATEHDEGRPNTQSAPTKK